MHTATWLVSRALRAATGPWDTRMLSDDAGEYFARALLASHGTRFVPRARIFYRVSGPGGLSHIGRSDRQMEALFLSMQLHVEYLRSLEDSARTRAACLAYLQTGLTNFYPERRDLIARATTLAASLGGTLAAPRTSIAYACVERCCGTAIARRAQMVARAGKFALRRRWERALGWTEAGSLEPAPSLRRGTR
jgi:hypothetical protein